MEQVQVDALLNKSTGQRVTKVYIERRISNTLFTSLVEGSTVTICQLTLDNGYSVRGESACVDPTNYNEDLGRHYAYEDAFKKLWPLFGFLLAERMHVAELVMRTPDHSHEGEEPAFEVVINLGTPFDLTAVEEAAEKLRNNGDHEDD